MPKAKPAEPAEVPGSSPPVWDASQYRVKWIAGEGVGTSHPVKSEEEARKLAESLKKAVPEGIGWKILATRGKMI